MEVFLLCLAVIVLVAYYHFCLYFSRLKKLSLQETKYLYGVPSFLLLAVLVEQVFDSSFLGTVFWTLGSSIIPIGVPWGFIESEFQGRKWDRQQNYDKLSEDEKEEMELEWKLEELQKNRKNNQ